MISLRRHSQIRRPREVTFGLGDLFVWGKNDGGKWCSPTLWVDPLSGVPRSRLYVWWWRCGVSPPETHGVRSVLSFGWTDCFRDVCCFIRRAAATYAECMYPCNVVLVVGIGSWFGWCCRLMFLAWMGTWVCMLYPWGGVDMCKHAFRRLLLIAVSGCLVRPVVSGTCFVLCGELGH